MEAKGPWLFLQQLLLVRGDGRTEVGIERCSRSGGGDVGGDHAG